MPYLLVNLDDPADCRRAFAQLASMAGPGRGCGPRGRRGPAGPPGPGGWMGMGMPGWPPPGGPAGPACNPRDLPLGQKLRRIRQRGVWRHLLAIARQSEQPRSLQEWDAAIGLPPNKMRSLKAIMAKLENRFGLRFLEPVEDAGADASGNPRYAMPARVRQVILRIAAETPED